MGISHEEDTDEPGGLRHGSPWRGTLAKKHRYAGAAGRTSDDLASRAERLIRSVKYSYGLELELRRANDLAIGQKIIVVMGERVPITYEVRRGDSLSAIAARYGVSVGDLAKTNGLRHPNLIRPGQKLLIRQGAKTRSGR